MRIYAIVLLTLCAVMTLGVQGLAECIQEPSEPLAFCITPEVPIAGQIATFELSDLASPSLAVWKFGDGQEQSTLLSNTVDHKYVSPGRYTVQVWISNTNGTFDSVTRTITVHAEDPVFIPTPITSFDLNRNRRIDNSEFFAALDQWMAFEIKDLTFFEVLDAWINGALIVEVRSSIRLSASRFSAYAIYDLTGSPIATYDCGVVSHARLQQVVLSEQRLPRGTYVIVERDCVSGLTTQRFILVQ